MCSPAPHGLPRPPGRCCVRLITSRFAPLPQLTSICSIARLDLLRSFHGHFHKYERIWRSLPPCQFNLMLPQRYLCLVSFSSPRSPTNPARLLASHVSLTLQPAALSVDVALARDADAVEVTLNAARQVCTGTRSSLLLVRSSSCTFVPPPNFVPTRAAARLLARLPLHSTARARATLPSFTLQNNVPTSRSTPISECTRTGRRSPSSDEEALRAFPTPFWRQSCTSLPPLALEGSELICGFVPACRNGSGWRIRCQANAS